MFIATLSLTQREIVRFLRQRSRVIGGLAPPLLFWFIIGSGVGESFQPAGSNVPMTSLEYLFPGTLLLIMLFTAIFSTISVIEDRREGFLQSVLVAPNARGAFVLGKILGGTLLALVQVVLVLLLAPFMGIGLTPLSFLKTTAVLFVVGFGFTGLGFLLAWRLDSSQGFHALMNLLLMPMWILSGALFPPSGAPGWLRAVMLVNPVSHALDAVRAALYSGGGMAGAPVGSSTWGVSLGVSILFSFLMLGSAWLLMNRPRAGDLS